MRILGACACLFAWLSASSALAAPAGELPGITDEPEATPGQEPAAEPTEDVAAPAETEPAAEPTEEVTTPSEEPAAEPAEPAEPTEPPSESLSDTTRPPPEPALPTSEPTSSPATSSSPPPAMAPTPPASAPAEDDEVPVPTSKKDEDEDDEESEEDEKKEKFKHKGFIVDVRPGLMGCTRNICARHGARPGFRLDGVLGRNFLGFLDLTLAGGWGRMGTRVAPGTDGLAIYGLDLGELPEEVAMLNFDGFTVTRARLETIQAGLDARVHILPRGRFDPYVGVGVQYSLFQGRYDTPDGLTRVGFHGVAFPLQAGFVVFVHKNFAFGAQFDYLLNYFVGLSIRGAPGNFAAPIAALSEVAAQGGVNLPGDLPHFWNAGAVIHIRLGKD